MTRRDVVKLRIGDRVEWYPSREEGTVLRTGWTAATLPGRFGRWFDVRWFGVETGKDVGVARYYDWEMVLENINRLPTGHRG